MSTTTVNFHSVVDATAHVRRVETSAWLDLEFKSEDGSTFALTVFTSEPESILAQISAAKATQASA